MAFFEKILCAGLFGLSGIGIYQYNKVREKCITLNTKEDRVYYDIGRCELQYCVSDTFGNKYHIRPFLHKTITHEQVSKLTEGKSYNIAYYGFPMKFFDKYPTITHISPIE